MLAASAADSLDEVAATILPVSRTVGRVLERLDPISEEFFGWFLIGIVADAVLFTWVFNSTSGSLVLALLFHAAIAVTGGSFSLVRAGIGAA